jgi:hypothetical protein
MRFILAVDKFVNRVTDKKTVASFSCLGAENPATEGFMIFECYSTHLEIP